MRQFMNTVKIFGLALMVSALSASGADEKKPAAQNDPTGTWHWSFTTPNGDVRVSTLKLKREGEKLTGAVSGRGGNETAIEQGTLKGDVISFQVVRERDGTTTTSKFNGKVTADLIKGKMESNFGGDNQTRDWEAKRGEAPKTAAAPRKTAAGNWKYTLNTTSGQKMEPLIMLKQDGEKLTGNVAFGENEAPISEGTVKDNDLSFKIVREVNGRTVTSTYKGKQDGDTIKGKITSNWGGNDRTYDFEANREK